jgi:CBS domain-containing protein
MMVREILHRKGHEVVTVQPGRTLMEALRFLVSRGIGSLVVTEGGDPGEILGILTERDILRAVDRDPEILARRTVGEEMTREVIVAEAGDDVAWLMEVMTRNRIRHLPVVERGRLVGMVSIGDVVNALRRDVEAENRYLRDYVQGVVR